jgi:hypothetical protein
MATRKELRLQAKRLLASRSSRITHYQGVSDPDETGTVYEFLDGAMAGQELSASAAGSGWKNTQGAPEADPNNVQDITEAKDYVQQHVAEIDDPNLSDAWKNILACLDGLSHVADNPDIPKAEVNRSNDGTTEPAHHIPTNTTPNHLWFIIPDLLLATSWSYKSLLILLRFARLISTNSPKTAQSES